MPQTMPWWLAMKDRLKVLLLVVAELTTEYSLVEMTLLLLHSWKKIQRRRLVTRSENDSAVAEQNDPLVY